MARIDLKKSSGFSLSFDQGNIASSDLSHKTYKDVSIDELRPQLLNQELSHPNSIYRKYYSLDHDNIFSSKKFALNVYFIPPNLAGIEYIKTRAIRSSNKNKIYEVWYGGGTVIMQNYFSDNDDVIVSKIRQDKKFIVPRNYALCFVNTRQSNLIVAEISPIDIHNNVVLDEMRGMAYYVIRKNAKQEIVKNPLYKDVRDYRKVNWDLTVGNYGITLKTPIIKQILRKYEKFSWLFDDSKIEI